jgi:signal transduction histidine kinase
MGSDLNWSRLLTLLAHELRSPSSVITGYARLMKDGRLDGAGQLQAMSQIESAASVIATVGRQASELSKWISPQADAKTHTTLVPVPALLNGAIARIGTSSAIALDTDSALADSAVSALDRDSLGIGLSSLLAHVCREALGQPVHVSAVAASEHACEILAFPASLRGRLDGVTPHDDPSFLLTCGGTGLSLALGTAVISAHGGAAVTMADHPEIVKVTLPLARKEPT